MDAHLSKDAHGHGRSFLVVRSWSLIFGRTLMDAHGRSFLVGRSWGIGSNTEKKETNTEKMEHNTEKKKSTIE